VALKGVPKAIAGNTFGHNPLLESMCEDDLLFEAPAEPVCSGASSNRQFKATKILGKFYVALIFGNYPFNSPKKPKRKKSN